MIELLALVGVLHLWFIAGYALHAAYFALAARYGWRAPAPRRALAWIEAAVTYGPLGVLGLFLENWQSRRRMRRYSKGEPNVD